MHFYLYLNKPHNKDKAKHGVRNQGNLTLLTDPTQVESKKTSQIHWPVPSINAELVIVFLGE